MSGTGRAIIRNSQRGFSVDSAQWFIIDFPRVTHVKMAKFVMRPFVYDETDYEENGEEFELAFFANIPKNYGYIRERYVFAPTSIFGKLNKCRVKTIRERNIHIKNEIIQTYIDKNEEPPPSFEIAFYDFWGDKNVVYLNKLQWAVNQVGKLGDNHLIAGLPRFYNGSGKCDKSDEDAKQKMIAARNKHTRDYLIGKYRAPAKIEIDDLTKKMNSAKLDDSAKPAVSDDLTKKMDSAKLDDSAKPAVSDDSDSVEYVDVDLDDYVLKTKANARVRELKKTIKEMKKKMEKMIPEESFNQVVKEKVSDLMKEWWRGGRKKSSGDDFMEFVKKPWAHILKGKDDPDDDDDDSDDDDFGDDDSDDIDVEFCSVCNVKMNPDDDKHYCDTRDGWFCPDCFPGICDDDLCDGCQTTQENMD